MNKEDNVTESRCPGLQQLQHSSCELAAAGRRCIQIYSQRLMPRIYAQDCFINAVRRLLIGYAHARVQIIVCDAEAVAKSLHPLVSLAQQMTSKMEIRQRAEEFSGDQRSFLLVDGRSYLIRELWSDLESGRLSSVGSARSKEIAEDFVKIWENSPLALGLRRLSL